MISQRTFTFCCIPAEIYNDTEVIQHHILTVVVVYICLRQQILDFFGCLRLCKGEGGGQQIWYFFGCLRVCKRGKATHMRFLWVFKIVQGGGGECWEIWEELKGGLLNRLKGFINIVNFIWMQKSFKRFERNSSWQIFLAANQ